HEIATNRGFDPLSILENIIVIRVYNSDHQILIVEQLDQIMLEQNIKLIVVDSVISHFRSEFVGRESLPMRQQRLNQHLHRLLRMAEMY
ncbi:DNA repair and recombination protein RadA, partial [candidate division KSB1 bacterium]|nr:DNA repair and recombination protein RadA [candidate division KSB1 bacterium]